MRRLAAVKTTRITVETETVTIVRQAEAVLAWCPECRARVQAITLQDESPAKPVNRAQIQQWLGTDRVHFWLTAEGPARICLSSLLQNSEPAETPAVLYFKQKLFDRWRRKQK